MKCFLCFCFPRVGYLCRWGRRVCHTAGHRTRSTLQTPTSLAGSKYTDRSDRNLQTQTGVKGVNEHHALLTQPKRHFDRRVVCFFLTPALSCCSSHKKKLSTVSLAKPLHKGLMVSAAWMEVNPPWRKSHFFFVAVVVYHQETNPPTL